MHVVSTGVDYNSSLHIAKAEGFLSLLFLLSLSGLFNMSILMQTSPWLPQHYPFLASLLNLMIRPFLCFVLFFFFSVFLSYFSTLGNSQAILAA